MEPVKPVNQLVAHVKIVISVLVVKDNYFWMKQLYNVCLNVLSDIINRQVQQIAVIFAVYVM